MPSRSLSGATFIKTVMLILYTPKECIAKLSLFTFNMRWLDKKTSICAGTIAMMLFPLITVEFSACHHLTS